MTRRGYRIATIVGGGVILLFAGRWVSLLLADRWWADQISPAAGQFLTKYRILRLLLDLSGVTVASTWFIANFFVVYRAIGSVQVPRRVANLEIHEALTPRALVTITVVAGLLFGIVTGMGVSAWSSSVLLAWHGVQYNISDPGLGKDLGFYLAQLPLWRRLHGQAFLLVALAFGTVCLLYVLVGSIRWQSRRLAISNYARRHIGWLLVAVALVLVWGYWLEPVELVSREQNRLTQALLALRTTVAEGLAGTALAAAVISAVWALKPRHALAAAGWLVMALGSILGHHILPYVSDRSSRPVADSLTLRDLERISFGLGVLEEGDLRVPAGAPTAPAVPSIWDSRSVNQAVDGDSTNVVSVNQSALLMGDRRIPVWIAIRRRSPDSAAVIAIADHRTTATGGPLAYRLGDTLPYPGATPLAILTEATVRPGAPPHVITTTGLGVPVGGLGRRLVLAWARQAGELFRSVPADARLLWHLDPVGRLQALAPYVAWNRATAHVVDGEVIWLSDGYVSSTSFPLVARVDWHDRPAAWLASGFLGVIHATTGETHIYIRNPDDPLIRAMAEVGGDIAEPVTALPAHIAAQLFYPDSLFSVQARVLERPHWTGLAVSGRSVPPRHEFRPGPYSYSPEGMPGLIAAYEAGEDHVVTTLLAGLVRGSTLRLRLLRLPTGETMPAPSKLVQEWSAFPTYEQLLDSLRAGSVRADSGAVRLWFGPNGVGAYQATYGFGPAQQVAVAWMSIAEGNAKGAGRNLSEAWQNLAGLSAPLVGASQDPLEDARRYMAAADSALRRGDWLTFGRAFQALKEILKVRRMDSTSGQN